MSDRVFRFEYRVLYALCTLVNHVYYARYLEFLVAARAGAESVVCYGGILESARRNMETKTGALYSVRWAGWCRTSRSTCASGSSWP